VGPTTPRIELGKHFFLKMQAGRFTDWWFGFIRREKVGIRTWKKSLTCGRGFLTGIDWYC